MVAPEFPSPGATSRAVLVLLIAAPQHRFRVSVL